MWPRLIQQKHVIISGKVQGVWFRASTKQQAEQLGITGWVRNTKQGHVEAVFQGDTVALEQMISWCHQGPPLAHVQAVDVTEESVDSLLTEFMIKY